MSFTVKSVSMERVKDKCGKSTKAVAEALLELCPLLSLETVLEDTDAKYSAILRICNSDLAVNVHNIYSTQIQFSGGKYSEGQVHAPLNWNTSGSLLNWSTSSSNIIEIAMYTLNDAVHIFSIGSNTSSSNFLTVGKLKSQFDGQERPVFAGYMGSSGGQVLADDTSVVSLAAIRSTLSGHDGAITGSTASVLIMAPVYYDCASQFLGLPTIGGGTMYYTNRNFTSNALYTINGRRFYFFNQNVCVDVS